MICKRANSIINNIRTFTSIAKINTLHEVCVTNTVEHNGNNKIRTSIQDITLKTLPIKVHVVFWGVSLLQSDNVMQNLIEANKRLKLCQSSDRRLNMKHIAWNQ